MANKPKNPTLFVSNSNIRQDVKSLVVKNPDLDVKGLTKIIDKALTGTCSNTTQTRRRNLALSMLEEVRSEVVASNKKQIQLEKVRQWKANNKDRISAANKKYYAKNREKRLEYCKTWRKNNQDKVKAYRERIKDRMKVISKEWRENNPDKVKEYRERAKAKKLVNNNIINNVKNTNKTDTNNVKNNNNNNTNNTNKNTNKQVKNTKKTKNKTNK